MTKLYEVPRNTWVKVIGSTNTPPGALAIIEEEEVLFKHIDGMYSYCKNKQDEVVHLPAWQEVEIINDPRT